MSKTDTPRQQPPPEPLRELTSEEIAAATGAGIHWGNSQLGFSWSRDGLTVCAAGSCGTIWWEDLTKLK